MVFVKALVGAACLLLVGCQNQENKPVNMDDLSILKKEFIEQIQSSCIDEGPFDFNYTFRSVLFSKQLVSLFGEISVHDRLPHGWNYYEGKTFYTLNGQRTEIFLNDLFKTEDQREYLRKVCEDSLKKEAISYFVGEEPLRTTLDLEAIRTFVIDAQHLFIIFQPYTVGGSADGPFIVKIPFEDLIGKWQAGNLLEKQLPIAKNFISSWEKDHWISDVQDDHSIAYQHGTFTQFR